MMRPIDFRCSHWTGNVPCNADPGEPCEAMPPGEFHAERRDAAQFAEDVETGSRPSDDAKVVSAITEAVDERLF